MRMSLPLFPNEDAPPLAVPGLTLTDAWIDAAEERALVARVDAGEWRRDFKRRVQVFGLGYGADVAPAWLGPLPRARRRRACCARVRCA
jgi:hypothetical protein